MAYDKTKDQVMDEWVSSDDGKNGYEFTVHSYDGGEPKIQVSRFYTAGGNKKFSPMGRLTKSQAHRIMVELDKFVKGAL